MLSKTVPLVFKRSDFPTWISYLVPTSVPRGSNEYPGHDVRSDFLLTIHNEGYCSIGLAVTLTAFATKGRLDSTRRLTLDDENYFYLTYGEPLFNPFSVPSQLLFSPPTSIILIPAQSIRRKGECAILSCAQRTEDYCLTSRDDSYNNLR